MPLPFEPTPAERQRLGMLRILVLALGAGAAMFALTGFVAAGPGATGGQPMVLRTVWAALAVSELGAYLVVRHGLVPRGGTDLPRDALLGRFASLTLIGAALVEALALFGGIIHLLTQELTDLALAAVPLIGLFFVFPTDARWTRFADRRADDVFPPRDP